MNLNHTGTVTINTERLILRRFKKGDDVGMFYNWASDDDVTKYLTWASHKNIAETQQVIDIWLENYKYNNTYQWGIEIAETGDLIGSMGLFFVDDWNFSCELGYCIGKAFWGKGYTTEASKAVIDYCFRVVGFNRITACCTYWNKRSINVIEKCGMRYEGFARQKYKHPAYFQDCNCYAIIKRDFDRIQAQKITRPL